MPAAAVPSPDEPGASPPADVVLLGSGGWIPTERRETCCVCVASGRTVLLLDAGSGVRRLLEQPELLRDVTDIHVLLTHFHLDHVAGLSYLPALSLPAPPVVWGPGRRLYDTSTRRVLELLLGRPFFSAPLETFVGDVRELDADELEIGPFAVRLRRQDRHPDPTLGIRLGDALAYCTDTAFDPGTAAFASGCSLLLHEAWHAAAETDDPGHAAAGEAGRLAREAGVEELVLVHLDPLLGDEGTLLAHARAAFERSSVGEDLLRLSPSPPRPGRPPAAAA